MRPLQISQLGSASLDKVDLWGDLRFLNKKSVSKTTEALRMRFLLVAMSCDSYTCSTALHGVVIVPKLNSFNRETVPKAHFLALAFKALFERDG